MVLVKLGVRFDRIAPSGFRLLAAIDATSCIYNPLWITSGTDGEHSGPDDPHTLGEAYDVRSHDFDGETKQDVLVDVMMKLGDGTPIPKDGGYVTEHFFGWLEQARTTNEHYRIAPAGARLIALSRTRLEQAGTENEHFHFQLRRGSTLTV